MYGFPMLDGVAGPKVASEQDTVESDPDAVDRPVAEGDARSVYADHARGRLRGITAAGAAHRDLPLHQLAGRVVPGATASRVRGDQLRLRRCSGHGFKHSAALGEALAQRLLGRTPRVSLAPFLAPL